jgi:hypothetical protein
MLKGTPCSGDTYAPLKTSSKNVHKYWGPGARLLAGFGAAPDPYLLHRPMIACRLQLTPSTNPAKRVRAWALSRHHGLLEPALSTRGRAVPVQVMARGKQIEWEIG